MPALMKAKEKANRTKCSSNLRPMSGEYEHCETDMMIPSRGMDFVWQRTYHSRTGGDSALGHGWDFSYNVSLIPQADGTMLLCPGNGRCDTFYPNGTNGWARDEYFAEVRDLDRDGMPDMLFADGGQWFFHADAGRESGGRQTFRIVDRFGNTISLHYDSAGRCAEIVDTLGRTNTIAYNSSGQLSSLTDFTGRAVRYEYDSNGDLTTCVSPTVTGTPTGNDFPGGKTNRYVYSSGFLDDRLNHNLTACIDASGKPWMQVIYQNTNDPASVDFDAVDFIQRGQFRETLRRFPQTPSPSNQFVTMKAIYCDPEGRVSETYWSSRGYCRHVYEPTGLSVAGVPVTETSNRPTGKLRAEDPDGYDTRFVYNDDGLCTHVTRPASDPQTVFIYERDLNPDASARKKGDCRVIRRIACCNGADTDGDGVPDATELTWRFEYDPRVGSEPMMERHRPTAADPYPDPPNCCGFALKIRDWIKPSFDGKMGEEGHLATDRAGLGPQEPAGRRAALPSRSAATPPDTPTRSSTGCTPRATNAPQARAEREWTDANAGRIRDPGGAARRRARPAGPRRPCRTRPAGTLEPPDLPPPGVHPGRGPSELRTALRVGGSGKALVWIVRNAVLPAYNDGLDRDQPELVADIDALLREESGVRYAVATSRIEARYGPDNED